MLRDISSIVRLILYFHCAICAVSLLLQFKISFNFFVPGFSVAAPWAFIWFSDGHENKVDISIVGTNGKFFLINAHGVLRRMGAATEIPGNYILNNM